MYRGFGCTLYAGQMHIIGVRCELQGAQMPTIGVVSETILLRLS